ncbi:MAG: 3-deoxy-D-manno-octulosonic acid transferase [Opitutales bacterium]|nr:3-deoxy-D-manno-octulosonic acid transferase [Opitutales bacterium]
MLWAYRILFLPLLLLASPYYLWRMVRRGGYGAGFSQRLGFLPALPAHPKRVWIQAVSVGEIEAIGPLLKELKASGQVDLVLTTTTSTGYRLARERYAEVCSFIGIFPLDFWPCSALAYRRLQPSAIVLTEGELWPEHLGQARARKLPTLLINARLSDRSFARHQRFKGASRGLLAGFTWIGAGSEEDARRLMSLGAEPANIDVTGNLKFDVASDGPLSLGERLVLRQALGFDGLERSLVLLGSSTWEGEEALLLDAVKTLRSEGIDARLLLAPRHAERREALVRLLAASGLSFHQRSTQGTTAPVGTVVHFADTTGELRQLTRAADLAFTGKSLAPHDGGQTPVECAAAGVPVVYGPHMTNFKAICQGLERVGAARKAAHAADTLTTLLALARDAATRTRMGQAGQEWHASNRGASHRTAQAIMAQLR